MLFTQRTIMFGAAILSFPTFAGGPMPFDGWSVSNGTIAANCGAGFNCSVLTSGQGFIQQQITDPVTKLSFIKTIVTHPQATGVPQAAGLPFSTENYVRTGNFDPTRESKIPTSQNLGEQSSPTGIANQQRLHVKSSTATLVGSFDTVVVINSGWAAAAGTPTVDITQAVSETGSDGTVFSDTARILGTNDNKGVQLGTNISLDSTFTQSRSDGSAGKDTQAFALRRVGGNLLPAAGKGSLGTKSVSWKPNDVAQTVWMGQQMNFGSFGDSGTFGFQAYDNLSDGVAQINSSSTSSAAPVSWVASPFGPAPTAPAGGGSTGDGGWGSNGGGWSRSR